MNVPKYRVGQYVTVLPSMANEMEHLQSECKSVKCRIIYPIIDGRYFVEIVKTGGYALVDEGDIDNTFGADVDISNVKREEVKVIFFGNGQFALPTLKQLLSSGYNVCAVVTRPDKPAGRGKHPQPSAVKLFAKSMGIPVWQPLKLDGHYFRMKLEKLSPDIGVVVEFRIIPQCSYTIPRLGTINLHSSLLPEFRGASTITSAIREGRGLTGVTTFKLDDGIDMGDIINNLAIPISSTDNAGNVHDRMAEVGAFMVDDAILRVCNSCRLVPQHSLICEFLKPSYAPKLNRADCLIPWWKSSEDVYNFIRSISPTPSAWTNLRWLGTESHVGMKIFKASCTAVPKDTRAPGELFIEDSHMYVACGDGVIEIEELQMPNRKRMLANDFLRGYRGIGKGFCSCVPLSAASAGNNAKAAIVAHEIIEEKS